MPIQQPATTKALWNPARHFLTPKLETKPRSASPPQNRTIMTATLLRLLGVLLTSATLGMPLFAQPSTNVTESGNQVIPRPRDGFYDRYLHTEEQVLAYDFIHEKDVFWEKRTWRLIDARELRNHIFRAEKAPFLNILLDAGLDGDLTLYNVVDDAFSQPLSLEQVEEIKYSTDTITIFNPETLQDSLVVVRNELNWEDVSKYRLKEVYFFDEETSTFGVRILGIAPIIERLDDNGNFLNEGPLFWAYYPEARPLLARHEVFNPHNDAARLSWEDVFEARLFDSYIIKANNLYDKRIKDYKSSPMAILVESERIQESIFNFEHDLWSY